jgi:hypothetical protein
MYGWLEYTQFLCFLEEVGTDPNSPQLTLSFLRNLSFRLWEAFCDPFSSTIEGAIRGVKLAASMMI